MVLKDSGADFRIWSCSAAAKSMVGNVEQSRQSTSPDADAPVCRYWLWRFDRTNDLNDPVMLTDFWGKTESQAVADLRAANDPIIGRINGPSDVELAVDPYYPQTIGSVPPELKGRTIHAGGRNRVFLDSHVQFIKDARTPLP